MEVVSRAGMHAALCLLLGFCGASKERSNLSCAWPGRPAPVRHRLALMLTHAGLLAPAACVRVA